MYETPRSTATVAPDDEALAARVLDGAFRLHRALGPGFLESTYRRFLTHALTRDGLAVNEEAWLGLEFEGLRVDRAYRADLIVNGRILVEVKSVDQLHSVHGMQVISYLKAAQLPLGFLINFNVPLLKQGIHRYVHPDLWSKL